MKVTPCVNVRIEVLAVTALLVFAGLFPLGSSADSEIAYVTPSVDGTDIRLHNIPRNKARKLFSTGRRTAPSDRVGRRLDWNRRGSELAFDSGHNAFRSLFIRDIYTVTPAGRKVRRITNPPDPAEYRRRAKGSVVVDVRHFNSSRLSVFVQGAKQPVTFTARGSGTVRVTFRGVADLGNRVRQYVRVFDFDSNFSLPCWFDVGVFADVKPGKTVYAGRIDNLLNDHTCPAAFSPSWTSDSRSLAYLYRIADTTGLPEHDVYKSPVRPRSIAGLGPRQPIYLESESNAVGYNLFSVFMSPSRQRAGRNQMFMFEHRVLSATAIYLADITQAETREFVNLPCDRWFCRAMDLDFTPNGKSFILARIEEPGGSDNAPMRGKIYEWVPADNRLRTIVDLPEAAVGEISLSSDGKKIAFTRGSGLDPNAFVEKWGQRLQCPCEIWTVNRDGTGLKRLRRNARTPAWRPGSLACTSNVRPIPKPID